MKFDMKEVEALIENDFLNLDEFIFKFKWVSDQYHYLFESIDNKTGSIHILISINSILKIFVQLLPNYG